MCIYIYIYIYTFSNLHLVNYQTLLSIYCVYIYVFISLLLTVWNEFTCWWNTSVRIWSLCCQISLIVSLVSVLSCTVTMNLCVVVASDNSGKWVRVSECYNVMCAWGGGREASSLTFLTVLRQSCQNKELRISVCVCVMAVIMKRGMVHANHPICGLTILGLCVWGSAHWE